MPTLTPEATAWDDAMERLTVRAEAAEARVADLEAAIREHRDRWAGQSTETDDVLYAVLEGKK